MNKKHTKNMQKYYENMNPATAKMILLNRFDRAHDPEKQAERKFKILASFAMTAIVLVTATIGFTIVRDSMAKEDSALVSEEPTVPGKRITFIDTRLGEWGGITTEDRIILMDVVTTAARGEGQLAMQAVAQAIRAACEKHDCSVAEIVEQYRWPTGSGEPISDEARSAVESVILGFPAVDTEILFACNPACEDPTWHEANLEFVCQIGNLRFYTEK